MRAAPAAELHESNQQAIGAWKRFAQGSPKRDIREIGGVTCAFSNVPMVFLNAAFLSAPVQNAEDFDNRVAAAVSYGSKSGVPWMFVSCNEWLPESLHASQSEAFGRHGLHAVMPLTGMVMDLPPGFSARPSGLEYRRVANRDTCNTISDMNCAAYGIPLDVGRESILEGMFGSDTFAYAGYLDGNPVTAAGVWIVDGILYVAMVATHPDHRRKGYADAVMQHSLEQAQKATGAGRTVLHATEAGFPVYERMGYRTVARFTVYGEAHE